MTQTTDAVLAQIDDAIADWAVGPDAMRCGAPVDAGLMSPRIRPIDPEQLARMSVRMTAAFQDFARGMAQVAAAVNKMAEEPAFRRLLGLPIYDRHHPRPLCIDGAAYARRQKARRGRR